MQKKIGVGMMLVALAMVGYVFTMAVTAQTIRLEEILIDAGLAGVLGAIGVFLLMADSIEGHFSPSETMVEFMEDVRDDLVDLSNFRPTATLVETIFTLFAVPIFVGLVLAYHKLGADWRGISVFFIGAVASAVVGWLVYCTDWFHDKSFDTPTWVYAIAAIGFVLSIGFGIHFAEPVAQEVTSSGATATWSPGPTTDAYNYEGTRGRAIFYDLTGGSNYGGTSAPSVSMPQCTGKGCGYAVLAIILILLVLAVVVASMFIPHFWVVGGMLLLTIMVMISLQELRQRPWGGYRY